MSLNHIQSGPSCSKQTASWVNILLKFQSLLSEIRQYFWLKRCDVILPKHWHVFVEKMREAFAQTLIFFVEKMREAFAQASLIFSTKNINVFGYKVLKCLTNWPLNEPVKLMMLWTSVQENNLKVNGYTSMLSAIFSKGKQLLLLPVCFPGSYSL